MGTANVVKYIKVKLTDKYPNIVSDKEINVWIYDKGLPSYAPKSTSTAFSLIDEKMTQWLGDEAGLIQLSTSNGLCMNGYTSLIICRLI